MSSREEVVIIGAGVAGCSIAFHLARRGVQSVIVERDGIAARASGKAWAVWTHPLRWLGMEGQPPTQLFSMPVGGVRPWVDLFWLGYHRLPDIIQEIKEKGHKDFFGLLLTKAAEVVERDLKWIFRERGRAATETEDSEAAVDANEEDT